MTDHQPQRRWLRASRTGILLLFVNLLILLAIEAVARVVVTVGRDVMDHRSAPPPNDAMTYSPELGWEPRPGYSGPLGTHDRAFDSRGFLVVDSAQVDAVGQRTVVFLGGSITAGHGVATEEAFPEVVEELLPEVAAINLGVAGYTSFQGRIVLERYLSAHRAEAVVVSFNYNDRRLVFDGLGEDGEDRFRVMYQASTSRSRRVREALRFSYTVTTLRALARNAGLIQTSPSQVRLDSLPVRVEPDRYRRNIREIVDLARSHGSEVILLLLPDNPVRFEPLTTGVRLLESGESRRAIEYLEAAADAELGSRQIARLYLGRAYAELGDSARMVDALTVEPVAAPNDGDRPGYLDSRYLQILREESEESGVAVVDGVTLFHRSPELFIDDTHLDPEGHRLLARAVAEVIAEVFDSPAAGGQGKGLDRSSGPRVARLASRGGPPR